MKKVCYNCHYIGEIISPRTFSYKLPIAGFLLGISVNALTSILSNYPSFDDKYSVDITTVSIFFFFLTLISGGYLLLQESEYKDVHPKRSNRKSSIIYLILGIILTLWGAIALGGTIAVSQFHEIFGSLIWLFVGLLTISYYIRDSNHCPNCYKIQTIIPIDEDQAQRIIRENNLTIPDDPVDTIEEPKPKMPWQA